MYDGVNLPRHAKSKREVSKEGMCQKDTEYGRNTTPPPEEALIPSAVEKKKRRRKTNAMHAWSLKNHKKQRNFGPSARFLLAAMMLIPI